MAEEEADYEWHTWGAHKEISALYGCGGGALLISF